MATAPDSAHQDMNAIIHHGLRRDLDRLARVLERPISDDQREALCRHVSWMLDYLHHHHVGEDEGVWPRTLAKRPDLQPMVDEMEAEHEALAAASDGLRAAAAEYARDGSDAQRRALAAAVAHMQEATLPHLDHEEQVAMPLVLETLDDEDWAYLEKNHFRKGISLGNAAVMFMWLLDDLDARRASIVKGELPGPVFWVLSRVYGPRYDTQARVRWGALAGSRS
jgi:hemerythrin-like domain-containing protein